MGENSSLGEKQQGRVLVSLALGGSPGEHPFHLENGDNPIKHTGLLSWGPNKSMLWNVTWCCNSLAVQWLRLCLPVQGVRVRFLVGELGSHMLWGCGQYFFNIKTKKMSAVAIKSLSFKDLLDLMYSVIGIVQWLPCHPLPPNLPNSAHPCLLFDT